MKTVFGVLAIALFVAVVVARPEDKKDPKDAAKKSPVDGVKNQVDGVKNQVDGAKKSVDKGTKNVGNIKPPTDDKGAGKTRNIVSDGIGGFTHTLESAIGAGESVLSDFF